MEVVNASFGYFGNRRVGAEEKGDVTQVNDEILRRLKFHLDLTVKSSCCKKEGGKKRRPLARDFPSGCLLAFHCRAGRIPRKRENSGENSINMWVILMPYAILRVFFLTKTFWK